jgi:sporulation protein YlmC with PRC-barrel domain
MSTVTEYIIGSEVADRDGVCGDLRRVVVDPAARSITHLVVEPRHRHGEGHLVPIDLVASSGNEIELSCTRSEFHALEDAEESKLVPGADGEWGYTQDQMLSLYPAVPLGGMAGGAATAGLGAGNMGGVGVGAMGSMGRGTGPRAIVIEDRIPEGEVEVRRGEQVHATDGAIGHVQGLVVDPSDQHVTHFLLDEGHLWGKKRVAIPISAVTGVDDGVQLSLTKGEVEELPSVGNDHVK